MTQSRRSVLAAVLFAALTAIMPVGVSATGGKDSVVPILEEVVVVGKRPGPPLWRVKDGDRTLWVFGTLSPLPKSLQWEPQSVDWIVSQSQAYLSAPERSASTRNPIKAIGVLRKLRKLKKLPNSQKLDDVLPAELFRRFADAKARFAPRDDQLLRLRPMAMSGS